MSDNIRERLERQAGGQERRGDLTVNDVLDDYIADGRGTWSRREGEGSNTEQNCELAFREIRQLYGDEPAEEMTPVRLRAVQLLMCESGLCCSSVNQRTGRIRRAFKLAAARMLLPAPVYEALRAVDAVRPPMAPVHSPVTSVPVGVVKATVPYLGAVPGLIVRLMLLTGMRPGEAVRMRGDEIEDWMYRPTDHKNKWRGKTRIIPLGPQAQQLLMPIMSGGHLFLTRHGRPWTVRALGAAVRKACRKAGVSPWSPNMIRHTVATDANERCDVETAQELLGHSDLRTTERYLDRTARRASEYVRRYA